MFFIFLRGYDVIYHIYFQYSLQLCSLFVRPGFVHFVLLWLFILSPFTVNSRISAWGAYFKFRRRRGDAYSTGGAYSRGRGAYLIFPNRDLT